MKKEQVTETGIYEYSLPHWDKSIFVKVVNYGGILAVQFDEYYIPTKILDIPSTAIFSKWI